MRARAGHPQRRRRRPRGGVRHVREAARLPIASAGGAASTWARLERVRLIVLGVAVVMLSVLAARWLHFLWGALHSEAGRYDFSTYYAAAAALRADPHAQIYAAAVLARAGDAGHVLVRPPLPYTYPPPLALLLAPFTALPFRVLSRLWLLDNAGLWLIVTLLLAREIALPLASPLRARLGITPSSERRRSAEGPSAVLARLRADPTPVVALALSAALMLGAAPAIQTVLTGQVDLLVLLPLALVPALTRRGHERWVGALLAGAALLKLTPLLLLGYLALRRRWRALGAALGTLAVVVGLCLLVVGPGTLLAALPQALRTGTGDLSLSHNEALLASLLPAWAPPATWLANGVRVGLGAAVAVLLWRWPRGDAAGEMRAYAVALCALLLLSPVAWVHHYVWVLPAAAIAFGHTAARWLAAPSRATALALAVVVLACLALIWPLPYAWDTEPAPTVTVLLGLPLRPLALELRALGTLALAGVLAAEVVATRWRVSSKANRSLPRAMPSGQA